MLLGPLIAPLPMTAFLAELGRMRDGMAALGALQFQLGPAFGAEFGCVFIFRLALGAFHIFSLALAMENDTRAKKVFARPFFQ